MFGTANYPVDPFTLCGPGAVMHTHTHSYTQPYACPPAPCPPPPSDLDDRLKRIEALLQACAPKEDPDPVDPVDPEPVECLLDCLETCGTEVRGTEGTEGVDLSCDSVAGNRASSVATSCSGTWVPGPCPSQDDLDQFKYALAEACGENSSMDHIINSIASRASDSVQVALDQFKCTVQDMVTVSVETTCVAMDVRDRTLEQSDKLQKEINDMHEVEDMMHANMKVDTNAIVGGFSETVRRMLLLQNYWNETGCDPTPYPIWVYQCALPVPSQYLVQ